MRRSPARRTEVQDTPGGFLRIEMGEPPDYPPMIEFKSKSRFIEIREPVSIPYAAPSEMADAGTDDYAGGLTGGTANPPSKQGTDR